MKKPQMARAANISREGTAVVVLGSKKEEAKTLDEEGVTGALIRTLKGGERTVCVASGSGEHRIDDTTSDGFTDFQTLVQKDNYKVKSVSLLEKAEVPSDCLVFVIGGPSGDYIQPAVDGIKKYVEGGGRALIMLDPPLKLGRKEISDNDALTAMLSEWGGSAVKNLVLDDNPVSQLVGVGPEVPLITSYESHAIINDLAGKATALPRVPSLEGNGGVEAKPNKLFFSSTDSLATYDLPSAAVK